jgi:hypothetical protein
LFTHTTVPNISVQHVFSSGFDLRLRLRLAARQQLRSLLSSLQDVNLGEGDDVRVVKLTGRPYMTRHAYTTLDDSGDSTDIHGRRIWGTRLPNKVKVFAWLYFKDRLSTKTNLHAKHVVDSERCERCSQAAEDRHHVFFGCVRNRSVWSRIHMIHVEALSDNESWYANTPTNLDASLWPFVYLAIFWRIWDDRNGHVFRSERFCPS